MQGKIYKIVKILGRINSRTVMMERFQDAEFSRHCCPQKTVTIPRIVCVLYLLFTQPSLIRSFHSSDPCFSVSCPKGVGYARVYCIGKYSGGMFLAIAEGTRGWLSSDMHACMQILELHLDRRVRTMATTSWFGCDNRKSGNLSVYISHVSVELFMRLRLVSVLWEFLWSAEQFLDP